MLKPLTGIALVALMSAPALGADLICYEYDLEGRLKKATRDDGSQLEYSFVDPSSEVDRNDNRQQLFQRTGQQADANCATPTGAPGTRSSNNNAIKLTQAPATTFFADAVREGDTSTMPTPVLAAINDRADVHGAFQSVFIDVFANDRFGQDAQLTNVTMPAGGFGFVRMQDDGVVFTSAASDGIARFAYQIRSSDGTYSTAHIKVLVSGTGTGGAG